MPNKTEIRVLLVDDQKTIRGLARFALEQIGIGHIEEAGDGSQALEKLRTGAFDLVLSDWNMAPMDGLALLAALRADPRTPFILMAGKADMACKTDSKPGLAGAVVKPFDTAAAKATIEQALGGLDRLVLNGQSANASRRGRRS